MGTNETQVINELRDKLGKAIQRRDLAWFKESVEQVRSRGAPYTPLHLAASSGNVQRVQLLLDRGANIEARSNSFTPLHLAAWRGNQEVVKTLLDHGANINAQVRGGETALHLAASNLDGVNSGVNTTQLLLDRGAEVDSRDMYIKTPLHSIASSLRDDNAIAIETIEVLLGRGADINATDINCSTPLHEAVWHGKP